MAQIDHGRERQRLAEVYAGMSDLELTELSQDAQSLTDDARYALGTELSQRGLKTELAEPTDPVDMTPTAGEPDSKIVTLRQFLYLQDALVAKNALDAAGIESFLADEHSIRLDLFMSNVLGGIKLWVKEKDAREADELLAQDFSQELEGGGGEG
jgi:hypothetical protein